MWIPFYAAIVGSVGVLGLSAYQGIRALGTLELTKEVDVTTAHIVPWRRLIPYDVDEDGAEEVLAWTQDYEDGQWRSRITAFDAENGEVLWQSQGNVAEHAAGARACLVSRVLVVTTRAGEVWGINPADGTRLWEASHDAEVAECCVLGEARTSGLPTHLVFEAPDGTFARLDGSGTTIEAQATPECDPVPSDCHSCGRPGTAEHRPDDPFVLPGGYASKAFRLRGEERTLIVGSKETEMPVVGLLRGGSLAWHQSVAEATAGTSFDFDASAVALAYRKADGTRRVRSIALKDGHTLWDVGLASPDEEEGGVTVTLSDSFVFANHANIAHVLRRANGEQVTVLGGTVTPRQKGTDGSAD